MAKKNMQDDELNNLRKEVLKWVDKKDNKSSERSREKPRVSTPKKQIDKKPSPSKNYNQKMPNVKKQAEKPAPAPTKQIVPMILKKSDEKTQKLLPPPRKKHLLIKALVFLVIILLLTGGYIYISLYQFQWHNNLTLKAAQIFNLPAITVNEYKISFTEYYEEWDITKNFYQKNKELDPTVPELSDEELKQFASDNLIKNKILLILAGKNNIEVTDQDVEDTYNDLVQISGGVEQTEEIISNLYMLTPQLFKAKILKNVILEDKLSQLYLKEIFDQAMHAKDLIESNTLNFEDFGNPQLIAEYNFTQTIYEELDPFKRRELPPEFLEFEEAAFNQEAGTISEPILTQLGFHLIKVENVELDEDGNPEVITARHILFMPKGLYTIIEEEKETIKIKNFVVTSSIENEINEPTQ